MQTTSTIARAFQFSDNKVLRKFRCDNPNENAKYTWVGILSTTNTLYLYLKTHKTDATVYIKDEYEVVMRSVV